MPFLRVSQSIQTLGSDLFLTSCLMMLMTSVCVAFGSWASCDLSNTFFWSHLFQDEDDEEDEEEDGGFGAETLTKTETGWLFDILVAW